MACVLHGFIVWHRDVHTFVQGPAFMWELIAYVFFPSPCAAQTLKKL